MKVQGVQITGMEISAGLAAMIGRFTAHDVDQAMRAAGSGDEGYRAADRLVQRERKAGRIKRSGNIGRRAAWERVA